MDFIFLTFSNKKAYYILYYIILYYIILYYIILYYTILYYIYYNILYYIILYYFIIYYIILYIYNIILKCNNSKNVYIHIHAKNAALQSLRLIDVNFK